MNVVELLAAHAGGEVAPPSSVNAEVPSDLERVVLRCLEKKPEDRFSDAASLGQALDACKCAADWTVETAATWWAKNQEDREQAVKTENQPVEVTVDFNPDKTVSE